MVLLYIDVLGMKARWRSGGVAVARTTYSALHGLVRHGLATLPPGSAVTGAIQSDAVALVFSQTVDAVRVGQAMYERAFRRARSAHDDRLWLRGVIVSMPDPARGLVASVAIPGFPGVEERTFSDELLHAINSEQAGFKGARLLIEEALIDNATRQTTCVAVGTRTCYRLHALRYTQGLPGFWDVLWMIPDTLPDWATWEEREKRMRSLIRWTGGGGSVEELMHVAATEVAFVECRSILLGLGRPGGLPGVP